MSHTEQALAVARGLGRDTSGAAAHIAALAATLECGDAYTELTTVRGLCASFAPGRALLLPDVLRARAGDPAAIAIVAAAAAECAGLRVDIVSDGESLYLAHPEAPMVIEPGAARLFDGHTLGVDLLWQCEHETAAAILDRLQAASRFN